MLYYLVTFFIQMNDHILHGFDDTDICFYFFFWSGKNKSGGDNTLYHSFLISVKTTTF